MTSTVSRTLAATFATAALAAIGLAGASAASASTAPAPSPTAPGATALHAAAPDTAGTGPQWMRPLRDSDRIITGAQLRELYRGFGDPSATQESEDAYVDEWSDAIGCMVGKRFLVDPRIALQPGSTATPAATRAFYGHTGTGDRYRWQDAGCLGSAVHVTGHDDDH